MYIFIFLGWGQNSVISPRGWHQPDSDLIVLCNIGLFCPRKKLDKVMKLFIQKFLKYSPNNVIGGFQVLS